MVQCSSSTIKNGRLRMKIPFHINPMPAAHVGTKLASQILMKDDKDYVSAFASRFVSARHAQIENKNLQLIYDIF